MLFYVSRPHAGKFVDVKFLYSLDRAGSAIDAGKLYGLLFVQFINLEITAEIAARGCFLEQPAARFIDVVCIGHVAEYGRIGPSRKPYSGPPYSNRSAVQGVRCFR
jgi:hypothetical protein